MDGLAEFNLGPFGLQLALAPELAGHEGISVNINVKDAAGERERLTWLVGASACPSRPQDFAERSSAALRAPRTAIATLVSVGFIVVAVGMSALPPTTSPS